MSKERVAWIDIARGIGIILVVYGHALSAHSFRYLIYSFHMPLFFFISGLVFTYRKDQSFTSFVYKNARAILYPYFIFAILSFVLWVVTRHPGPAEQVKQFLSIFYGNGNSGLLNFNNILWFLPCLFITRVGFFLLTRISVEKRFLLIALFLCSGIGYLYSLFFSQIKLPFGIETAITAIVFLGGGFLWMGWESKWKKRLESHLVVSFLIFLVVCIVFAVLNYQQYGTQVDLRLDRLNNYAYFYLAAFAGTIATIFLSQKIRINRVLEYLGQNSLVIFAWHLLLFSYITRFLSVTNLRAVFLILPPFLSPMLYSLIAIIMILLIAYLIRKITAYFQVKLS